MEGSAAPGSPPVTDLQGAVTTVVPGPQALSDGEGAPCGGAASCALYEPHHGRTGGTVRSWDLPHDLRSAPFVRDLIGSCCQRWNLSERCLQDCSLVASELVSNSLTHALPPITVSVILPPCRQHIRLEVSDGGSAGVEAEEGLDPDEHGRGNIVISTIAASSGHGVSGQGLHIRWAALPTCP
ncbi:ATP-binding protein [Streptomyces sp. NPDC048248]|uniref:ATP-binding protein n=1 Tax=Streptomyces sp. NPDC048248 TaxID=3365523 RepID=UPI003718F18F